VWFVILVISRDIVLVTGALLINFITGTVEVRPRFLGKATTFFQTTVVVLAPGLGDEIQAIKAGIMEIGDVFVVNKADRENVDKTISDIEAMLNMNPEGKWRPAVIKTTAITGEGATELLDKIDEHREYLRSGALKMRRREMVESELVEAIKDKATESIVEYLKRRGRLDKIIDEIVMRKTDPYSAADRLLAERLKEV
jgi:LAO/AO transport system kinase